AIHLIAVDQRVLAETARAPGPAGLPSQRVLVVANVVVSTTAGPALATTSQSRHGDLIARRERLHHTCADADNLAGELMAADQRVRPLINARVDALLPRTQSRGGNSDEHL